MTGRRFELVVAADDRTGALEVAGACADAGVGGVVVRPYGTPVPLLADVGNGVHVVDLGTRHLEPGEAGERAVAAAAADRAGRHAHKLDSGLRGNWATELVARGRATGHRALVVAALPAEARACVGGVVLAHGTPIAESEMSDDARQHLTSSRPADHLRSAGAVGVAELMSGDAIATWLAEGDGGFGVCDAGTVEDLAMIAASWITVADVLLAGTSAAISAAASALAGDRPGGVTRPRVAPVGPAVGGSLIVCGSLHRTARAQVAALAEIGAVVTVVGPGADGIAGSQLGAVVDALRSGSSAVLTTPETASLPVPRDDAVAASRALAAVAEDVVAVARPATVIVIGGDTAAAVLGDGPILVRGTVAPGTPVGVRVGTSQLAIVTRSGSFGGAHALVDLVTGMMGR